MAIPKRQQGPGRPRGRSTQRHRFDTLREMLIQRPRGMTLQEIAESLQITSRSARRYLAEVRHELEIEKKPSGGRAPLWRLPPQHRSRKIALRPMQLYSLLATRHLFDGLRGSALYDEIELAFRNLLALARNPGRGPGPSDTRLDERFVYIPEFPADYTGQAEDLDVLVNAAAELRPVWFRHRDARGHEVRVELHPYAIVLHQDTVYAVGRLVAEDRIGVLALHQISDAEASTREMFELPATFDVGQFFPRAFGLNQAARKVRVVIDFDARAAPAIRARRISAGQRRSNLRGGGVRLAMNVGDLGEVARWVLGFGDQARVVEPDSLREQVMRELRGALASYRERKA